MLSLPFKKTALEATQKIRNPGVLKLLCDTHTWMQGWIHVFDHPYYAETDDRGQFSMPNVRAGTYTLKAWHEDGATNSFEITVPESGDAGAAFEFAKKR